uniref:Uncharacterized protein n=1 Tax=Anopheles dirus TaxID=7168 RepID=A0A182N0Z3_9DIPT
MRILFQNEPVYGNYEDSGVATSADAHSLVFDEPITPPPASDRPAHANGATEPGSPLGELETLAKALAQAQGAVSLVKRPRARSTPGGVEQPQLPRHGVAGCDEDDVEDEEDEGDAEHGGGGGDGDGGDPAVGEDGQQLPHLLHHRHHHLLHHHHHLPHQQRASSRMSNTSTSTIKQHYYPEGGWGWIIVLVGVLVHVLTHGLQTAVGVLILAAGRAYRIESIVLTD